MGRISRDLEEFRKVTKVRYRKLIESLVDKYCWKCPMRSTRMETFCREAEIWLRLSNAFELGVHDELTSRNIPVNCLEVIAAKTLGKKIKEDSKTLKFQKLVLLKVQEDMSPFADKGSFLLVKERPKSLERNDLVLLPGCCSLSIFWFSKLSQSEMPLKLFQVIKSFQKRGLSHVRIKENLEVPIEFVFGIVLKV